MNLSCLNLRRSEPRDAAAIAALITLAFSHQAAIVDPPASALRITAADIAACLSTGGGLIAEVGTLVGSLIWAEQGSALYLSRIAVDPAWRRQGIAKALLAAAEAVARRRGLPRMTLGTRLVLTGNRALFAAAGFREVSLETHPGYSTPTWVALERALSD